MVKEGLINLDFADVRAVMKEMGKAMMGTGEASGEKRALTAAEAAISNPLIDDASMKGAKGLLISITGGKDLTLYEVDEAATRIREEVDQDANIIVGATFDESLDGLIRVSVVATGIDNTGRMRDGGPAEEALKLLAGKARTQAPKVAPAPAVHMPPAAIVEHSAPPLPNPAVASAVASVESAAHAAVAAAILPQTSFDEVSIRPKAVKPSLFDHVETESAPPAMEPPPAAFIPPAPERVMRAPRMPRAEDLPLPGRALIEKKGQPEHPEQQRKSLMQRLAAVGLGRRTEEEAPQAPRTARAMPQYQAPARPSPRQPEGRGEDPVSEYARRAAPQGLDQHGRQTPVNNPAEEDQLDIPAFLRRQAN
jgi:cell division protein FtsZ